jgi:hypothetical protein
MSTFEVQSAVVFAVLVGFLGAAAAVLSLRLSLRRDRDRRELAAREPKLAPLVMESVILQMRDGSAISGVLTERSGGFFVLHNARLMEAGGAVDIDGAAWTDERNVSWIQVEGGKTWP